MDHIETGIESLDKKLGGGLPGGSLTVIASRLGICKTSLAIQLVGNIAKRGNNVLFFSLVTAAETVKVRLTKYGLEDTTNIVVDDTPTVGIDYITRKIAYSGKVDAVIIDYIQLIKGKEPAYEHFSLQHAEILTTLKNLVKTLEIPLVVTSQLNSSAADRLSMMNAIREYGTLQQDADIIIFPYQEALFLKHPDTFGKDKLIVGKNRYGEIGDIPVHWNGKAMVFEERE